jgi:SPP1 family predicted phage head-tail adaptor
VVLSTAAAKYRHRIAVTAAPLDSSRDTFGRRKGTGTTVCTIWAEKQDWQGDETTQNNREFASVTVKWKVRYRTDITPEMQIVEGADTYNILSVLDFDGTHRELVITSRKVEDL